MFFLVPTGRAQIENMITPEQHEKVFNWLYDLSQSAPFDIKSTAAPMYRRVAIQRKRAEAAGKPVTFQGAGFQYADGLNRPTKGVNDGNGFLFISHIGEIQPSGFLPITAGDVRTDDIVDVYRHSQLFTDLRSPDKIKGRCGICEYRDICGGQRPSLMALREIISRPIPACSYIPKGI